MLRAILDIKDFTLSTSNVTGRSTLMGLDSPGWCWTFVEIAKLATLVFVWWMFYTKLYFHSWERRLGIRFCRSQRDDKAQPQTKDTPKLSLPKLESPWNAAPNLYPVCLSARYDMSGRRSPSLFERIFCLACCNPDDDDLWSGPYTIAEYPDFKVYSNRRPERTLRRREYIVDIDHALFSDETFFGPTRGRRAYNNRRRFQPQLSTISSVSSSSTMSSLSNLSYISSGIWMGLSILVLYCQNSVRETVGSFAHATI